jgi:predicted phosphodiesterase
MKSTLILSDTHIGESFVPERAQALIQICQKHDQIILNGDFLDDFWDFKKTTKSEWKDFFNVLKQKEVIYLFGNHDVDSEDLRITTQDFVNRYDHEYRFNVGEIELIVMHGHSIYPRLGGILYEEQKTTLRKITQKIVKLAALVLYPIILCVRLIIERSAILRKIQRPIIAKQNKKMKAYAEKHLLPHQILVCGHSHLIEDAREKQFINTGANCYDRLEYLSIVNNDINLKIQSF